ncbi:MAG: hypothetical protein HC836_16855 [Richelia sp. RM2_1_2]|nr:hypothetical protein [Richelia sp. RM2_1_2]
MGIRFYYYDMFVLLSKGHFLVRFNDEEPYFFYLDGHQFANVIGGTFVDNKWVKEEFNDGSRVFYSLSHDGWRQYRDGKNWFTSLPLYYKILGRLRF